MDETGDGAGVARLLVLEDSEDDLVLLRRRLRRDGLAVALTRVVDRAGLEEALEQGPYDLFLCDYLLPGLDGLTALGIAHRADPQLPVVILSGVPGESRAVEAMRAGASHYLLKRDLSRITGILRRELELREERRRAEAALAEVEGRFGSLFQVAPSGILVLEDERVVLANPCAEAMFLREAGGLQGAPVDELLPEWRSLDAEGSEIEGRRGGGGFPCEVRRRDLAAGSGRGVGAVLCVQDISQRVERERRYRQFQHLETIGRLTGGIAHDFNNLLTVILGGLDLTLESLPEGDARRADLEISRDASERSADLVRRLLAFGRQQHLEPRVLDLTRLVEGASRMLSRVLRADIRLVLDLDPGVGNVRVDPREFERVLMNLAVNAADAMPRGGELTLRTTRSEAISGAPEGLGCLLEVRDSGTGMPPEVLEKIFEPFFTSKGEGKGTGLGLATSYGIVKQSGGEILVESAPGEGSCFRVFLPRVQEAAQAAMPRETREAGSGGERILLVEDDPDLRRITQRFLDLLGYQVLTAEDARSALETSARVSEEIDLLVTDLILPGAGGVELARELREHRPGMRILFVSGYAAQALEDEGEMPFPFHFLAKPFNRVKLGESVREALAG